MAKKAAKVPVTKNAAKAAKVPVSERAIMARINRRLKPDFEALRKCRSDFRFHGDLGDYYIVDLHGRKNPTTHQDLEDLGRELKVLREWETLVS